MWTLDMGLSFALCLPWFFGSRSFERRREAVRAQEKHSSTLDSQNQKADATKNYPNSPRMSILLNFMQKLTNCIAEPSRKRRGTIAEASRKRRGTVAEASRNRRGSVAEASRNCLAQFMCFCDHFRSKKDDSGWILPTLGGEQFSSEARRSPNTMAVSKNSQNIQKKIKNTQNNCKCFNSMPGGFRFFARVSLKVLFCVCQLRANYWSATKAGGLAKCAPSRATRARPAHTVAPFLNRS